MAKQFLLDRAKRKAYGKARQNTINLLIRKYPAEYEELFTIEKSKQEALELSKAKQSLDSLEEN